MSLTTIEFSGTTGLLTDGTFYYLQIGAGPLVELSNNGAPVTVGAYGGWAPIAAQQTSTGYEVAWKLAGADQYGVWNVDSSGNFLSDAIGGNVSGTSATLESLETSFNTDLNGDGVIGVPPPPPPPSATVIESNGSMSLLTDGTDYLLEPNGGTAVKLSNGGSAIVVGQFGGWTAVAAAQTATGYEVALKQAGTGQYAIWNTDSTGAYVSTALASASGSSALLESFEASFNFDLNGDGTIGIPDSSLTLIEFVWNDKSADGRDKLFFQARQWAGGSILL